jgi:DNA mismatch repair protein MutL
MVSELVTGLGDTGRADDVLDRAIKVMACHGSVRAKQRLSPAEAARLVEQLAGMDLPTNCPHGRPIFRRITYGELERMFKRVV